MYFSPVGQSGQTYCIAVKDERDQRGLQTVSLTNMPSSTSNNSSVIQYTPSADGQYFIPGMIYTSSLFAADSVMSSFVNFILGIFV